MREANETVSDLQTELEQSNKKIEGLDRKLHHTQELLGEYVGKLTEIEELKALLLKRDGQIARLKKRLRTKMKYEAGYLKATSTTPQLIHHIEQKDLAVLEE